MIIYSNNIKLKEIPKLLIYSNDETIVSINKTIIYDKNTYITHNIKILEMHTK